MEKERKCPECGNPLGAEDKFCDNCGTQTPVTAPSAQERPSRSTAVPDSPSDAESAAFGAGARINAMGGISTSSVRKTDIKNTNVNKTDINTSNVDNSTNYQNTHNTIIMGGKEEPQFCEVCGNPFGEKHARCPKCGIQICFDCKVPGKNRCVECEKKAINEYRTSFQQLLFASGGDIGVAGRQMMDQKARELDVEKEKAGIEAEILKQYRPASKPVPPVVPPAPKSQPAFTQPARSGGAAPQSSDQVFRPAPKASASPSAQPQRPAPSSRQEPPQKGKTGLWVALVALAVAAAGIIFFVLPKSSDQDAPAQEQTVTQTPAPKQETPAPKQETPAASPKPKTTATPAAKPAAPAKDTEYEAGMAAYKAEDGLKALEHFKKSGSADSYYMIGLIYENGCGSVAANAMLARKNYKTAADKGSSDAKAKL